MGVWIIVIAIVMLAGLFLAMFGQPAGWIILAAGVIALFVALVRRGRPAGTSPRAHPHGPEDRQRGPNDDPMQ